MNDEEILELDSWNLNLLWKLDKCIRYGTSRVFYSKKACDPDRFNMIAELNGQFYTKLLVYDKDEALKESIEEYMCGTEDPDLFFVISRVDLRKMFPQHFYQMKEEEENINEEILNNLQLACYPNKKDVFSWYTKKRVDHFNPENNMFFKVIFLDIDGVLNDEGDNYNKGVIIDHSMVKCLKSIVDATDARIILSSSWKWAYQSFVENNRVSREKNLYLLQDALDKYGIVIDAITPFSNKSGSEARPLEIREWLMRFTGTHSYVILDDDTFWHWGWLQRNVVTTKTKLPEKNRYGDDQYVKGLTPELAQKAIAILNDTWEFARRF